MRALRERAGRRCSSPASAATTWRRGPPEPVSDRRLADHGLRRDPAPAAARSCGASGRPADAVIAAAARRAGHHRQPGFHPPRRAPRARGATVDPDRRLCLALGLGLAAGPRARDARLCRSCAGAAAVRAGGASRARRAALQLCRPSAGRAGAASCAPTPTRRGGGLPIRRSAGAAGKPQQRDPAASADLRRGGGAWCGSASARSRWCCRRCRICASGSTARSPPGRCGRGSWSSQAEKQAAFRIARAALAKSGTVTLELALAGVPMVAAYKVSPARGLDGAAAGPGAVHHPGQPGARRERGAGDSSRRTARPNGWPTRWCRCSATRRSGGGRSRPSPGSMPSWKSAPAHPRPAPPISCWPRCGALARPWPDGPRPEGSCPK